VVGIYDKHRLVPFGEYLPADALMTRLGVKSMAHLGDGFATGPEPRPLRIAPDLLVQPLICYESLFPRLAKPVPGVRAIVNVSNDAWFGVTSGPLQHLNLASYRAIETGLPLIRATPTGVSALIDAQGRILPGARLKLGESGVIDGKCARMSARRLCSPGLGIGRSLCCFWFHCRRDSRPRGSGLGKSPKLKQTGFQIPWLFPQ
jgi:apolipoprotein N-acyltransferase